MFAGSLPSYFLYRWGNSLATNAHTSEAMLGFVVGVLELQVNLKV